MEKERKFCVPAMHSDNEFAMVTQSNGATETGSGEKKKKSRKKMGGRWTKQTKTDGSKKKKPRGKEIKIRLRGSIKEGDAKKKEAKNGIEANTLSAGARKREEEKSRNAGAKEAKQENLPQDKGKSESSLLDNGIISRINGRLLCALCDAKLSLLEASNHAKLKSHMVRLAIFEVSFKNQRLNVLCKTCGLKLAWDKLKIHAQHHRILPWHKPSDLYMTLFKHRVSQHLGIFYCYTCEKVFSDWYAAHSHTSRSSHRTLSKAWLVPLASCDALASIYELSVRNSIFASDSVHAECKICHCQIVANAVNVAAHVVGSQHSTAQPEFAKFLVDAGRRDLLKVNAIRMEGNGKYWCAKCARTIGTFDQATTHVTEEGHCMNDGMGRTSDLPIASKRERTENAVAGKPSNGATAERVSRWAKRETGNTAATEPPDSATGANKIPAEKTTKLANGEDTKPGRKISKPESSKRPYNVNEKTQCDVCRKNFPNDLALHAHMAGHYSLEFMGTVAAAQDRFLNGEDHGHVVKSAQTAQDDDQDSTSSDDLEEGPDKRPMRRGLSQGRKVISPVKMRKIVAILTFKNDDIYTMKDKLREFELATRLSFEASKKDGRIYCLVCMLLTEFTAVNYLEHMISLNHSVWLEKMERDHARFEKFPDQFSAIDLGVEYMVEHEGRIYCHPCDRFVEDLDDDLRAHMGAKRHVKAREAMRDLGAARFDLLVSSYICNWYMVQLYCCIPCLATYRYEVNFSKHLASKAHATCMQNPPNTSRQLVFDFCNTCALLWYGYRRTSAYHRMIGSHFLLDRDGHYKSVELTDKTRQLLRDPKHYVDDFVERCEIEGRREREKEATIVRDIQAAVHGKFPEAKAHLFGSRVTGLGSLGCDIDVFLDCGNLYNGSKSSRGAMLELIGPVAAHLKSFSDCWVIEELLTACRSPIIRAHHKVTELDCDISFENGLAVENTKLIRSYNERFPPCRQMIIFLKRWATLCGLTGTGRITSYALYWHVIFYLQHESILPSVAELIAKQNTSCKIDGWEVGVSRDFTCNGSSTDQSLCTLLTGFFRFWSTFDHRDEVACPLIGKPLKKMCFVNCDELPVAMKPYVDYLNKSTSGSTSEPFRIDSNMCIQDPFDLQHNLTKAVRKVYLKRFRQYCSLSYEILVAS